MSVLAFLIPITLAMGVVGLAAFIWSLKAGQYEDLAGAAERVLLDDDDAPPPRRRATDDRPPTGGLRHDRPADRSRAADRPGDPGGGRRSAACSWRSAGSGDPLGVHGFIVLAVSGGAVLRGRQRASTTPSRRPTASPPTTTIPPRSASCSRWSGRSSAWRMGVWVAALLAWPELTFDAPWSTFGRLRPLHTSGVIFGFGGNALIATSFHVMQRTSRARLPGQISPWFVLIGFNLFCVIAASGYLMGVTQSKEYAEPEWYADIWLVVVWVTYFVLYLRTLARRNEPHIYVANWYYLAFILVVAVLHIVNNLAVPASLAGAKSYSAFSGVQDAMTQWWYGHNAVAFFLTAGFLGMLYYFLPKRAERPIYSYRLSILSFWGITFFYIWAGSHHLHYTALPHWVQTLGMTFSMMLLVPSWASAGNALMTLNGAWHKVRDDATLRFMMVAVVFYGLSTFEGSFMAIRAGELAVALHRLDRRPRARRRHGLGGADQLRLDLRAGAGDLAPRDDVFLAPGRGALLARAVRDAHLRLRDVELRHHPGADVADLHRERHAALSPSSSRWRRCTTTTSPAPSAGLLFLIGAIVGFYNVLMTIRRRAGQGPGASTIRPPPRRRSPRCRWRSSPMLRRFFECFFGTHYRLERYSIGLTLGIIVAAGIGGFIEIAPLFTIDETVEEAPDMRRLHAARAGRARHLRPRGLLRLPQPDDPHPARRGGALRALLAGGRVAVRPPDALGLEAHRPGPRAGRREVFRRLAGRASRRPAGAGAAVGDAALPLPAGGAARGREPARAGWRRCARVGVPYTDDDDRERRAPTPSGQALPDSDARRGRARALRRGDPRPGVRRRRRPADRDGRARRLPADPRRPDRPRARPRSRWRRSEAWTSRTRRSSASRSPSASST